MVNAFNRHRLGCIVWQYKRCGWSKRKQRSRGDVGTAGASEGGTGGVAEVGSSGGGNKGDIDRGSSREYFGERMQRDIGGSGCS